MVVSGVAMLTLSGTKVANAHDAWVAYVTPDGESELRLFWGGKQRFAAEIEPEGYIVLERTIAFEALPRAAQVNAAAITSIDSIVLVEEVFGPRGVDYEVYYRLNDEILKAEADG
ncbi:MAG: hypothetical protein H7Z43_08925 [Clostridia bacterium]|nr:hypothetical protein [Deltaproteobacteria bacterium]